MRKKRMKFPVWAGLTALLLVLVFQTAEPAYASVAINTDPASDLQISGYSITPATGAIKQGDEIAVQLTVYDTRITSLPSEITPTLSTASFTNKGNITITPIAVGPPLAAGALVYDESDPPIVTGCTYDITFSKLRYTGKGDKFSFNISYKGLPTPVPVGNVTLTLGRCVPYVAPEPTPTPTPTPPDVVTKGTGFVLKDARYGEGTVYAGQQFTLSAVILATNGDAAVENVSVAFTPPEQITLADGASVVYIGTISPGASASVSAILMPGANIQEGSYPVSIDVSGVNQKTGDPVSASMTVTIPVLQPERFEIFDATLPTDLTAGVDDGLGYTTVTLVNMGRGSVANVTAEIVGDGLYAEEGKQYLGNVGAGEQKVAEFVLHADTPGMIDAQVLITYENERGEQKSLERDFSVNVMEAMIDKPGMGPDIGYPPDNGVGAQGPGIFQQLWFWIVVVVAAAVIVTVLLLRRRRKRIAAAEAALDYSEDDD